MLLVGAVYWTSQLNDLNLDQKIKVTLRHNDLWGGTGAGISRSWGYTWLTLKTGTRIRAQNYVDLDYYAPPDGKEKLHWFIPQIDMIFY